MAQGDEMIQGFRDLVERNIEQARTSYGYYLDTVADALRVWSSSPSFDSRFKDVQELAMQFAKQNGESAFAMGKDLAAAKDLPQVVALQNRYAQVQMRLMLVRHRSRALHLGALSDLISWGDVVARWKVPLR